MARTVLDQKLETRAARAKLKPSGKPYYRSIEPGLHLGYRKGKGAGGKWVMRRYVGGGNYEVSTLGTADDSDSSLADGEIIFTFAQAQDRARRRALEANRTAAGLSTRGGLYTVKSAIEDYITAYSAGHTKGGGKALPDLRKRADAFIIPQFGDTEAAKLTTTKIKALLEQLAAFAPRLRTGKKADEQKFRKVDGDDPDVRRRRRSSVNRAFTVLKAALNHAWRDGKIDSDAAWRKVQPFREVDAARVRYLEIKECRRLVNSCDAEFRPLVEAALATGARYGELAALNVADFHSESGTVHIRSSKSGKGRHIHLNGESVAVFKRITAGRPASNPMFMKDSGGRWLKSHQARPMREACERAKIDPPASFHHLRHTWASLPVMNAMPLMVVAKNLGHADTRMVEKHYGHLAPSYIAEAVRASAPRFGIKPKKGSNVTRLEVSA